MAHPNFTLEDLRAGALASILFASVAFAPGYVAGWLTDCLEFRKRTLPTKLLLAIALSISLSPIVCYWTGWLLGNTGLLVFVGGASVSALALLSRDLRRGGDLSARSTILGALIVFGWTLACIASLVDLQIGERLYFSPVAHDYAIRAAITDAISRTGVRPATPFFLADGPIPLRYHHFWYILCSVVDQLGGTLVDARQSLTGGAVWAGIGLIAIVPLYLRFFCGLGSALARKMSLPGIGLLAVTGLDLIPVLILMKFSGVVQPDIDWWNTPILSWLGSLLWAPHYVVSLIACLMGLLLLWCAPDNRKQRFATAILAGLSFASAVGLSIYVTVVFAIFLGIWTLWVLAKGKVREFLLFAISGTIAGILVMPHLLTLVPPASSGTGPAVASSAFTLSVRPFRVAEILMAADNVGVWWRVAVHALLLPLNYFLEFGFFAVVAVLTVQRFRMRGLARHEQAQLIMAIVSILAATLVRSNGTAFNDLGMRGILVAQFVLLLWAVELQPEWKHLNRRLQITLLAFLAIGAGGTLYQLGILRTFPILADQGRVSMPDWLSSDRKLGRRTMAMRQAYAMLQLSLPRNAVVQNNPEFPGDDYYYGLYANRQTSAANRSCTIAFGGSPNACDAVVARISPFFAPSPSKPVVGTDRIAVFIIKDSDPIWSDRSDWVWRINPLFQNDFVRVIPAAGSP